MFVLLPLWASAGFGTGGRETFFGSPPSCVPARDALDGVFASNCLNKHGKMIRKALLRMRLLLLGGLKREVSREAGCAVAKFRADCCTGIKGVRSDSNVALAGASLPLSFASQFLHHDVPALASILPHPRPLIAPSEPAARQCQSETGAATLHTEDACFSRSATYKC